MKALLFAASLVILVALTGTAFRPSSAGIVANRVVDDNLIDCLNPPQPATYNNIANALSEAGPGDVIFVCAGTYDGDALQMTAADVQLIGPGFTPEADGEAILARATGLGGPMLSMNAMGTQVRGLTFQALPATKNDTSEALRGRADSISVTDNVFMNSIGAGLYADVTNGTAEGVTIQRNTFTNNAMAALCFCSNSFLDSNIIQSTSGEGVQVSGEQNIFSANTLNGVRMTSVGDNSTVEHNTFDATGQPMPFPLVTISGDGTSVVGNDFSNGGGLAVRVFDGPQTGPTSTEIILNTFDTMTKGIQVSDNSPGDAFTVTAQIGTEKPLANVFINSGGTLNPAGHLPPDDAYLLELDGIPTPIDATFNNWGLCTLAEIEAEINHQPDEPTVGTVDYDPFIEPDSCATPTPEPTATPTPTPEPTPTPTEPSASPTATPTGSPEPTPTGTPPAKHTQGDNDCDEDIDPVDALADLRNTAGLSPLNQQEPCPDVGSEFASIWGDMDCDEDVDPVDALAILRFVASLPPLSQQEPCPDISDPVPAADERG